MDVPSLLPPLPPIPPNFAKDPLELVQSTKMEIVVVEAVPRLKLAVVSPIGVLIRLYMDLPPVKAAPEQYGEF